MLDLFSNLAFIYLHVLFIGLEGYLLIYGLPLMLWRAIRHPVSELSAINAVSCLAVGISMDATVAFYLGSVPLGAMPCGPRLGCGPGMEFVYITQQPLPYLFKAALFGCFALAGLLLAVVGTRSLMARDAA